MSPPVVASPTTANALLSRAQRAHTRLSWAERLARNARRSGAGQIRIKLFSVPDDFALRLRLAPE